VTYPQSVGGISAARSAHASTVAFGIFLAAGTLYIVAAKSLGVSAMWTTLVPLLIISIYAVILGFARYLRLRDDQAGDNLYYLGFLYTLTSLGVSLWQFSTSGGAEVVVTNFGVAVSSTILGVALRVIFSQMRQDPLEVERSARLELADAARRVKQELDGTVLELSSFRRATQQSLSEGIAEVKKQIEAVSKTVVETLEDLPQRSAKSVENASKQVGEAVGTLTSTLASSLDQNAVKLGKEASNLASTLVTITGTLKDVERQLKSVQMPDAIIEIKLQPTIRSMTKALKDLSDGLGSQVDKLQTAINTLTTATQNGVRSSEATLVTQNRNSEQIIALLSSTQEAFRRLSDGLVAKEGQREQDSEMNKRGESLTGSDRAFPDTDRWENIGPAATVTNASSGRWPWSWR
jgi:hypothetical protein